jgi:hypothetical protein
MLGQAPFLNPADYIFMEARGGKEGYPDLWVCKYRLSADPIVQEAGRKIGLDLRNSAKEANGRGYIGNINREQAVRLNLALGGRTQNFRISSDLFKLLLSGKGFDGNGIKISKSELDSILEEIASARSPYRAEWYEDFFTQGEDGLVLNKNYRLDGRDLVPGYSEKLKPCLMENKTPGIELSSWARQPTSQGLVRKSTKNGDLFYWYPRANSAVGFYAYSGGADLSCSGDPQYSNSWLGARHVREAPQKIIRFINELFLNFLS